MSVTLIVKPLKVCFKYLNYENHKEHPNKTFVRIRVYTFNVLPKAEWSSVSVF